MYNTPLHCGHQFLSRGLPPSTGEEVYCRRCGEYRLVTYRSSDWRSKCVDCRYSRYCGADESWAKTLAGKHTNKYPGHRVKVFQANNPDEWELIQVQAETLPDPPRSVAESVLGHASDADTYVPY